MNSTNAKTIALLIILLVLGYFLYRQFNADDNDTTVVTETVSEDVAAIGADIAVLLAQINELQIDSELFSNTAYQSLTDFTNVISPLPQGKKNPFAPFVTQTKAAPKAR